MTFRIFRHIKSNHIFQVDKDLINVTNNAGKLTLEGATEYQRFRKIEINIFEADADYADLVTELDPNKVVADAAIALVTNRYSGSVNIAASVLPCCFK